MIHGYLHSTYAVSTVGWELHAVSRIYVFNAVPLIYGYVHSTHDVSTVSWVLHEVHRM